MDMSDIYLQNPMSSAEKNQWQSLFELNNQKSVVLYQAKQQNRLPQIQPLWVRLNNSIKQI